MASSTSPVSFEVEQPLWQRLQSLADHAGQMPISRLVETALHRLAAQPLPEAPPPRRQMSVRLKPELRDVLDHLADEAGLSRSRLIREALESLVEHPPLEWVQLAAAERAATPAPATAEPATAGASTTPAAKTSRRRRLGAGPAAHAFSAPKRVPRRRRDAALGERAAAAPKRKAKKSRKD